MNIKKRMLLLVVAVGSMLLTSGCLKLWQRSVDLKSYMITAPRDSLALEKPLASKLWISPVSVLPPFNVRNLVLRDSDVRFETSFYNELLLSPSENFRNVFYAWFTASGVFEDVSIADRNRSSHQLALTVMQFYGNRESGDEKTVLSIKATLFDEQAREMRVVFSKEYVHEEPVADMTADQLIRSFNTSVENILKECETDVIEVLSR